ncbi:hypothetical protein [Blastococcus haudaquaticus]|uniref:Uncharacterized protein n=1 Tax=Blastococcus haudaquaticus TaxID=1938745 RepID=A0A286H4Y8_9ACTN|nr:hypothetical protein [Blastococcus haudaquaticus]SOE02827.1 hypothetical protein SAMN06272739_3787 [Blastococcus haudaquaticus]
MTEPADLLAATRTPGDAVCVLLDLPAGAHTSTVASSTALMRAVLKG